MAALCSFSFVYLLLFFNEGKGYGDVRGIWATIYLKEWGTVHAAELKIFSSCKLKVKQRPLENNIFKRDRNRLEDEASEETNAGNL